MHFNIRPAIAGDVFALEALIDASVRVLQTADYTPLQIERALKGVYGVDTQLIADGTYFVVTSSSDGCSKPEYSSVLDPEVLIVGCGGWSKRRTLFGGDQWALREDALLDPSKDAAKIRAFFVHPDWGAARNR